MYLNFSGKTILVTGGTGSLGGTLLHYIITEFSDIERIIIYSRDELKQFEESGQYGNNKRICWKLGDIRDYERLKEVCCNVDYIFHLAALKQVPACEQNPEECIKTNITGTQNVIRAAQESGVKIVIAVSTDKAAAPVNAYGASKLLMEKLMISANNAGYGSGCRFSVIRFGNFAASRGSVIPLFLHQKQNGLRLTITDPGMTRFCIRREDAAVYLIKVMKMMKGGEIFIPKMKSLRIGDIAAAVAPSDMWHKTGIRQGERIHEELISGQESETILETRDSFIMITAGNNEQMDYYRQQLNALQKHHGFVYRSDLNDQWFSSSEIHDLLMDIASGTASQYKLIPSSCSSTTKTTTTESAKATASATESSTKATAPVSGMASSA